MEVSVPIVFCCSCGNALLILSRRSSAPWWFYYWSFDTPSSGQMASPLVGGCSETSTSGLVHCCYLLLGWLRSVVILSIWHKSSSSVGPCFSADTWSTNSIEGSRSLMLAPANPGDRCCSLKTKSSGSAYLLCWLPCRSAYELDSRPSWLGLLPRYTGSFYPVVFSVVGAFATPRP